MTNDNHKPHIHHEICYSIFTSEVERSQQDLFITPEVSAGETTSLETTPRRAIFNGKLSFDSEIERGNATIINIRHEKAPLLVESQQEKHVDAQEEEEQQQQQKQPRGFSAGYTDYMQSSKAFQVFFFHSLCYYLIAVLLFHVMFQQKMTIIDSMYFAAVLFTTIGYGDLAPTTDASRMATICLSIYGIVILGIFWGVYGHALMESQKLAASEQRTAMRDAARETVNRTADARRMTLTGGNSLIPEGWAEDEAEDTNGVGNPLGFSTTGGGGNNNNPKEKGLASDGVKPDTTASDNTAPGKVTEYGVAGDIFLLFIHVFPIMTLILTVGVILGHVEGWNTSRSIYWVVISGTTIGLGDETPQNQYVRLACVFFLPCCVAVVGQCLHKIASIYIDRKRRASHEEFFSRALTVEDLETMDTNSDGEVDKGEFLAYMLVCLQMVHKEDIDEIHRLFDALDLHKSGCLRKNDLRGMHESIQQAVISSVLEVDLDERTLHELNVAARQDPGGSLTRDLVKSYASKWKTGAKRATRRTGSHPAMTMSTVVTRTCAHNHINLSA